MEGVDTRPQDWIGKVGNVIAFHSGSAEYGWLSNFYAVTVEDDSGRHFRCVEGFFQAQKYASRADFDSLAHRFEGLSGPAAKKLGGKSGIRMTEAETALWDGGGRVAAMADALRRKFRNPQLRALLLSTGDAILVERLPRFGDGFWGVKKDGGANVLGQLLMRVRSELMAQ